MTFRTQTALWMTRWLWSVPQYLAVNTVKIVLIFLCAQSKGRFNYGGCLISDEHSTDYDGRHIVRLLFVLQVRLYLLLLKYV